MYQVYGDNVLCKNWFEKFNVDDFDLENVPQSRSLTKTDDDKMKILI